MQLVAAMLLPLATACIQRSPEDRAEACLQRTFQGESRKGECLDQTRGFASQDASVRARGLYVRIRDAERDAGDGQQVVLPGLFDSLLSVELSRLGEIDDRGLTELFAAAG